MGKCKPNKVDLMQEIETQLFILVQSIIEYRFEYKNLPDEIPTYIIEDNLFNYGSCVFFKDNFFYYALSGANGNTLDVYGNPLKVRPIAKNGMQFDERTNVQYFDFKNNKIIEKDCVIMYNNRYRMSTYTLIYPLVNRLCYLWQSLGINAALTRIKALLVANKDQAPSLKALFNKFFDSEKIFAIVNDKSNLRENIVDKLDFNIPNQQKDLWEDFDKTFNLLLMFCGINSNNNIDKKERLLVDELHINDTLTTIIMDSYFEMRVKAIEAINKLFGLNIEIIDKFKLKNEDTIKKDDE